MFLIFCSEQLSELPVTVKLRMWIILAMMWIELVDSVAQICPRCFPGPSENSTANAGGAEIEPSMVTSSSVIVLPLPSFFWTSATKYEKSSLGLYRYHSKLQQWFP